MMCMLIYVIVAFGLHHMHMQICSSSSCAAVAWTGWRRKLPVLIFRADALVCRGAESRQIGGKRILHIPHITRKLKLKLKLHYIIYSNVMVSCFETIWCCSK